MPTYAMSDKATPDAVLVSKIKKNDKSAELGLFERYKPFIFKYYKKLCSRLPGIERTMDLDDFTTEVYLDPFQKAIDYCNLKKIRDNNWKMVQIFGWYVKNLIAKYVREDSRNPTFVRVASLEVISCKEGEVDHDLMSLLFEDTSVDFSKEIDEKLTLVKFLKELPDRDKAILIDRIVAVKTTGAPRPYVIMAKDFGISKTLVQQRVKKMYRDYKKFCK